MRSARSLFPTRFICIFFSLIAILEGCGERKNNAPVAKSRIVIPQYSSKTSEPSFIVYQSLNFSRSYINNVLPEETNVVLALWEDGSVVWSSNGTKGGSPYMEATLDRDKVADVLNKINQRAVKSFGNKEVDLFYFGPDSSFTVMVINDHEKVLRLRSWHELYEGDANIVVTDKGIEMFDGRSRQSVINQFSLEYQQFLEVWTTAREMADSIIPLKGNENKNSTFGIRSKSE